MAVRCRALVLVVMLSILVAGCGSPEPTATPAPAAPTAIGVAPTNTPLPPTDTPLAPTDTPLPPTHTPVPPTAEPSPAATPTAEPSVTDGTWFKTYGGNRDEVANDILLAADGGFYIVGVANLEFEPEQRGDVYLIKTDAAGDILWERTYGTQEYEAGATAVQTSDGGLLISGTAQTDGGGMDIYLLKVDQDGNELWSRTFGGPLDEVGAGWPMDDGGYILGGNIVDPNDPVVDDPGLAGYAGFVGRSNVYLARIDGDGSEIWSRTFGGDNNVIAPAGLQTPDGGFIILATIMYFPEADDDIYLLKVDENGNEVWSRTWESGMSSGYDLVQTADGNYLITGPHSALEDMDRSKRDFLFIKVDPEGNEIWTSTFGDPDLIDYAQVLGATGDGGFIAAGGTTRSLTTWDEDIVIVKIDERGQLVWERIVETSTHSMFGNVLQHPDGGYVLAGSIFNGRNFDIFAIKTDAEGNMTAAPEPAAIATALPPIAAAVSPTGADAPALAAISVDTADQVERLQTLRGHRDKVFSLAFSGDGVHVASSSLDNTIRLWDVRSGQEVHASNTVELDLNSIAFSPDGRLLASADAVWDVESFQVVQTLEQRRHVPGHVAFSPDGSLLAVELADQAIRLWDVASGQVVRTFEEQADSALFFGIEFSPDGRLLAAGGRDGTVRLWDVASGQIAGLLEHGPDIHVHDVAFSPDSSLLASAGIDYAVRVWDVASGETVQVLWHRDGLYGVTFSPDGSLVASAGCDRTVKLWDVASGQLIRSLSHDDEVMAVSFSPDGTLLASGGYDHQILLWGVPR